MKHAYLHQYKSISLQLQLYPTHLLINVNPTYSDVSHNFEFPECSELLIDIDNRAMRIKPTIWIIPFHEHIL